MFLRDGNPWEGGRHLLSGVEEVYAESELQSVRELAQG